jgi:hypothetical protein
LAKATPSDDHLKATISQPRSSRPSYTIKATLVEVTKVKWEESLIIKAIVTYLDKLSETPDQGA